MPPHRPAAGASGNVGDPNRPVHSGHLVPRPHGDGATLINPDPNATDLHRQAWDHIQDSYGLGRVHVSRNDGLLKIELWTGIQPNATGTVCPELAQLYKTVVHLHRPIIQGGT